MEFLQLSAYWLSVMRRVSLHAVAFGVLAGGTAATIVLLHDSDAWSEAASSATTGILAGYVLFSVLISSAETVSASWVARRHGGAPTGEMMEYPCVREVRIRRQGDETASAIADEALHCLRAADGMRFKQVTEIENGLSVSGSGTRAAARMDVVSEGSEVVITLETRPPWRWKKLDGGASWGVARDWETRVRSTLRPSSAG
ncbi:hypothetical protein QNO07_20375 [Streptomyces sp. 549]|uniref:hypothetical protein n=1 Tax=Streptomyces sp. 549 TaxID=3049076 RepID=UPI0024C29C43|nr:hypothetical protein [Streptomyces sp. 549]MDK1475745.1 hypothetical protein [Streptomyces sp. 549]